MSSDTPEGMMENSEEMPEEPRNIDRLVELLTEQADGADFNKERKFGDFLRKFGDFLREVRATIISLKARVTELEGGLAECYRLSGADPDSNEDWRLAANAVAEVRRMREESDQAEAQCAAHVEFLRKRIDHHLQMAEQASTVSPPVLKQYDIMQAEEISAHLSQTTGEERK